MSVLPYIFFSQGDSGPGLPRVLTAAKQARLRRHQGWHVSALHKRCWFQQPGPSRPVPSRLLQPTSQPGPPNSPPSGPPGPCNQANENHFNVLLENARLSQSRMYAEGTKRNHRSNIKQFLIFCVKFGKPVCPTNRETLMAFARLESATIGYSSIKNIFSSIKFLHNAMNAVYPDEDWQVESTLKAIKRELSGAAFQTLPITPEILLKMYSFIDTSTPRGLAEWSCFLTSFYCLLRKSSAAPVSLQTFNSTTGLSRRKVSFPSDRNICMILQNHSKTNQFGNREMITPMVANPIQALCPVYHMKELFARFHLDGSFPAFSYVVNNKVSCVTYDGFTKTLRRLLDAAGFKSSSYSGHSFRRGGASFLYSLGADPLLIQATGDWQSDSYARYVFLSLDQRLEAQHKMAFNLKF